MSNFDRLLETQRALADSQAAFAASQQDVTRLTAERDELATEVRVLRQSDDLALITAERERDKALAEVEQLETTLRIFRNSQSLDVASFRTARDTARAELASAQTELTTLRAKVKILGWQLAAVEQFASAYQPSSDRGWAVAILHDKPCVSCKQDITCGQAYAPLTGSKGCFVHVVCPPPPDSPAHPAPGPDKEN